MKIVVAGEQISFYERFGYVELESFFSTTIINHLRTILASTPDPHDIVVSSAVAKKILLPTLGTTAFALVRRKPIRYAFDRLWKFPMALDTTIDSRSSVSPIMATVIIALEDAPAETPLSQTPNILTSMPSKAGNVLFVAPKTIIRPSSSVTGSFLVIGLTSSRPLYRLEPNDPHTHALKAYGYVFGDTVRETTHPVIHA